MQSSNAELIAQTIHNSVQLQASECLLTTTSSNSFPIAKIVKFGSTDLISANNLTFRNSDQLQTTASSNSFPLAYQSIRQPLLRIKPLRKQFLPHKFNMEISEKRLVKFSSFLFLLQPVFLPTIGFYPHDNLN